MASNAAPAAAVKQENGASSSNGSYTDFVLRAVDSRFSSSPTSASSSSGATASQDGLKYNVMKFANVGGDKGVDLTSDAFVKPVKLNRKDPRTVRRLTDEDRERRWKQRMLEQAALAAGAAAGGGADAAGEGADDKAGIKGEDGDNNDDDDEDEEEIDMSLVGVGTSGSARLDQKDQKSRAFRRKTQRVYLSSAESQRLKREEWMPWVLEGDDGDERWIGHLEGGAGSGASAGGSSNGKNRAIESQGWRPEAQTQEVGGGGSSYVAFVFGEHGNDFQIVPINRWYKFTRGPRYATLGTEEAEDEYNRLQKNPEIERWVRHKAPANVRNAAPVPGQPGAASATASKRKVKVEPDSSAASTHNRLLARSAQAARPPPEDRGRRQFRSVIGGNAIGGDADERRAKDDGMDEDLDFEDDFQDDEEGVAKPDQVLDEDEAKELEEKIKKEMRLAKGFEEGPDEDADDLFGESSLTNTGRELKKLVRKRDKTGTYDSDDDDDDDLFGGGASDDSASVASFDGSGERKSKSSTPRPGSGSGSRSGSRPPNSASRRPQSRAGSPTASGSAVIARRATSPQPGRSKSRPGSRSGSPNPSAGGGSGKRKREGEASAASDDGSKRRKNGDDSNLITESDLVALLKTKPSFTTKEVLAHFKKQLKMDPRNKGAIGSLLQTVANFVSGELQLKPNLQ